MKKHKFSWVDAVVIAVILLLIAGTLVKFLVLDPNSKQARTVDFTYEVQILGVRQYTVDALQPGDVLYEDAGKAQVGVITDVSSRQAETIGYLSDATAVMAPMEDRYDVVLTVQARGTKKDDYFQVGTYDIKVNHSALYFTKYSIWSGTVISIDAGSASKAGEDAA